MRLTIIGSGTAAIQANRGFAGHVLDIGNELCLLDGGSGTLRKCDEAGISYKEIDKICYTHLHPDHTTDLVPFLFATKHTPGFTRTKELEIYGPVGFREFFTRAVALYGAGMVEVEYEIKIRELARDKINLGDLELETNLMKHAENAIGYRFEAEGKTFVYSGDTDYCDEIIALARNADVLLLECSFPDHMKVPDHLTPTEAGKIAARASVQRRSLTHLYPPCDKEDILTPCRKQFDGPVSCAQDLMSVEI
jgi:ribonuclease BN (tRNA processing enzyme)